MFEFTRNFYTTVESGGGSESSFTPGRTIVSELSRLNKAFGTVSTKKTIIGQLSDIADAAEAGKIGGGNGALIVNQIIDDGTLLLDKTYQEIYDAMINNTPVFLKDAHAGLNDASVRFDQVAAAYYHPEQEGDTEKIVYYVLSGVLQATEPAVFIVKYACDSPDSYPVMVMEDDEDP